MSIVCSLCFKYIESSSSRYLISLKTKSGAECVRLLKELPFDVDLNVHDSYLCKTCFRQLKKREGLLKTIENIESELGFWSRSRNSSAIPLTSTPSKEHNVSLVKTSIGSTSQFSSLSDGLPPTRKTKTGDPLQESLSSTTCTSYSSSNVPSKAVPIRTGVKVEVTWPSQTKQRVLQEELEPLGKALLRGTWKDIASASFRVKELRNELLKLVIKHLSKECCALVSAKNPSILRKLDVDSMAELSLEHVCQDIKERAPLFYAMLMTVAIPPNSVKSNLNWLPSVAAAGAILLKERSRFMNGFQLYLTLVMKHTGFQAMCNIFSALKIGVTSTYYNKKCTEYGATFNEVLMKTKSNDKATLKWKNHNPSGDDSVHANTAEPEVSQEVSSQISGKDLRSDDEKDSNQMSSGFKIAFDNFDLYQRVHNMTEDNQNIDIHWVNHNAVMNRVSGNHLADDGPICDILELDNFKLLPSSPDHVMQRQNYITLVERVLTEEIPYLDFSKDCVVRHIPHLHSKDVSKKTEKECLGILFSNENSTEGMNDVLSELHEYVPSWTSGTGDDEKTHYHEIGVVGDQLTIERAVNCMLSIANGFTQDERLEGMHVEIADWHSEMNFLAVIYRRLYATNAAEDHCTLFADRNLINRRNVVADATKAYAPDKQMFLLAVKSRIIAAALTELGMDDINGKPTKNAFQRSTFVSEAEPISAYLRRLATDVVDKYIINVNATEVIMSEVLDEKEKETLLNLFRLPNGRFPCRFPGCDKSFKHFGKSKAKHELMVHGLEPDNSIPQAVSPLVEQKNSAKSNQEQKTEVKGEIKEKERDDVYNYQCNLLDHGLLYINFIDAIAEGDGDRIIRCWKFLMLHFYAGDRTKYSVEALYLLMQQYCLLSPCQSYTQRWNRSANNKGGAGNNVSLDLDLEHDNNYLKQSIRKMGPNITQSSVSRCCRVLKFSRAKVEEISRECKVMKRSGKHFVKNAKKDLFTLVNNLMVKEALTEKRDRHYRHFANIPRHPLHRNNLSGLCKWINSHKKGIVMGLKAR